jgi:hypothetical protein
MLLSTNQHTRAFWSDRFVVQFSRCHRKYLSGSIRYWRAILRNDESAGEHKSADRKKMPVATFFPLVARVSAFRLQSTRPP